MNTSANLLKTLDDVQGLLDADLADLADLADFRVPAAGRYGMSLSVETKTIGEHPAVVFTYEVTEVIELANPEDAAPTIGDKFGENFNIDNEYGLGKLKKSLKPYAEFFNTSNIGQLLSSMDGITITGTVKRREDKEKLDDDGNKRVYGSVVNVEVQ